MELIRDVINHDRCLMGGRRCIIKAPMYELNKLSAVEISILLGLGLGQIYYCDFLHGSTIIKNLISFEGYHQYSRLRNWLG